MSKSLEALRELEALAIQADEERRGAMARANAELNIYDPIRIKLLDDILERLIRPAKGDEEAVRMDAMVCISQLRSLIAILAPSGTTQQRTVKARVLQDEFDMIYWDEFKQRELQAIADRRKAEEGAIAWMGA